MKTRGFTILEVVVVLSIVAILVSIAIPRIMGFLDEARITQVKRELKTIKSALESYASNHRGRYPSQTDTITADLVSVSPQMVDHVLYDPFGQGATSEYLYSVSEDGKDYVVSSLGPDRINGTARIISFGGVPSSGDDLVATSGTITELNLNTDTNNCGEIGTECPAGQTCVAGSCTAGACTVDGDCDSGYSCTAGACVDVNECNTDNGGCDANATCTNTPSSFSCACNAGYSGDGTSGNCTIITYAVTFDSQSATVNADPTSKTVTAPATTVVSLPTAPTKTSYTFGGWYTQTNGNGSQFLANTAVSGNITVYAKWTDACAGTPAVGTVCADGTKYVSATLRTTTSDAGTMQWSTQYIVTGATSTTNGSTNTATLAGLAGVYPAADYCAGLSFGGHDDWYLPAKDELAVLRVNRAALGGDQTNWYWSSTEYDDVYAWTQYFYNGNQLNVGKTYSGSYVRCVRNVQ